MRKRILLEGLILIAIFGGLWGILNVFPLFPRKSQPGLSAGMEKKLGDMMIKSMLSSPENKRLNSDSVSAELDIIMARLADPSETDYDFTIIVLEDEEANAFAMPGGYIIITSGLFDVTETPEELAGVIAHEKGHIVEKHLAGRLLKNFTVSMLFSDNMLLSEASKMLISAAFDRDQEEAADKYALDLMYRSGIHPAHLGAAFRHLKEKEGSVSPEMEIFMSHPDIDSRIKAAYDYPVGNDFKEVPVEVDWQKLQNSVHSSEISSSKFL